MNRDLFNTIFDKEILPFIHEISDNNSLIDVHDLSKTKYNLYNTYQALNGQYKEQIFEKDVKTALLDRHKVASCICGAFIKCPVFDLSRLIRDLKENKTRFELYFVYVNEMLSLYAATAFLSFFMIRDNEDDLERVKRIHSKFPMAPPTTKNKRGFWNSVVFNLSQIKELCKNKFI